MPLGSAKRMTTRLSSGAGMVRAMNGLDVSTHGTRWKFSYEFIMGVDRLDIRNPREHKLASEIGFLLNAGTSGELDRVLRKSFGDAPGGRVEDRAAQVP